MANLFNRNSAAQAPAVPPRQMLMNKYMSARINLLIAVAFTAINLVLLLTNSNSYFLFSVFLPYFMGDMGMFLCGKYPAEYYVDMGDMVFLDTSFLIIMVLLAAVVLGLYLLCYFMSKKKSGWLIFALVLFAIDTAVMLMMMDLGNAIIDILFHAWVIYYLIVGVTSANKLKAMPEEEPAPEGAPVIEGETAEETAAEATEAPETPAEPDAWAELNQSVENSDETNE